MSKSSDGELRRSSRQTLRRIYAMPFFLGVISLVGMLSGLFGDGAWDWASWLLLSLLLALIAFFALRKQRAD